MPAKDKIVTRLYRNDVTLTFNPKSTKYRYTVTDNRTGERDVVVRGVTSVLKGILDKPELMRWPMNMSHSKLFAASFDETLKDYTHKWDNALIQPGKAYTAEELHEAMKAGARAHTERGDRGKDIGTLAHSAILDGFLKGKKDVRESVIFAFKDNEVEPDEETVAIIEKITVKFQAWWESLKAQDSRLSVVWVEKPIYSRTLRYSGTLDLCIDFKGKIYVLDLKTTNRSSKAPMGIYPEMFLQLGLYAFALREETGMVPDDLGIISITKDGAFAVSTASDMNLTTETCYTASAYAVRLHDWLTVTEGSLSGAPKSHLAS